MSWSEFGRQTDRRGKTFEEVPLKIAEGKTEPAEIRSWFGLLAAVPVYATKSWTFAKISKHLMQNR